MQLVQLFDASFARLAREDSLRVAAFHRNRQAERPHIIAVKEGGKFFAARVPQAVFPVDSRERNSIGLIC